MIHCQNCCDPYHYYCANLPANVVTRLTVWRCHRCATCSVCCQGEDTGRNFSWDIIETCFRCHEQFHLHCNGANNFLVLYRDSEREAKVNKWTIQKTSAFIILFLMIFRFATAAFSILLVDTATLSWRQMTSTEIANRLPKFAWFAGIRKSVTFAGIAFETSQVAVSRKCHVWTVIAYFIMTATIMRVSVFTSFSRFVSVDQQNANNILSPPPLPHGSVWLLLSISFSA